MSELDSEVDVLWVTTKAMHLESALALAPAEVVSDAIVIPLLNGVDHVQLLRGAIATSFRERSGWSPRKSIRGESARSRHSFLSSCPGPLQWPPSCPAAGIDCRVRDDEVSMLWEKLAFLAPVALATTALDRTLGGVRDDERYQACKDEVLAVARMEGASIDVVALRELERSIPDEMRSSMQKDVAAGREPELDAIAGPILRGGRRHDIAVHGTAELAAAVAARAGQQP